MPKVFVSYSHDSTDHEDRVLGFANALRGQGIDVELDRYHQRPPRGWPFWCEEQLRPDHSDFVLMICTETYLRRVEDRVPAEEGRGVFWEGAVIYTYLYDAKRNTRFIPVLFPGAGVDDVPVPVRQHQRYAIDAFDLSDPGYRALYRELTAQPDVVKPPVGAIVPLSPVATLPALPVRPTFPLPPPPSTAGVVFTLELDTQLRMTADERERLVALDELLLKIEDGETVSVRVTEPDIAASRADLTALRQVAHPTVDQRARIVELDRRLRGRHGYEPPFDLLLGEVVTTLLTQVVPRVGAIQGATGALECIAEILRWYADPMAGSGIPLDCLVKQHDWALKVDVEPSVVEKVAADHVGPVEWLVWDNVPVYVADFPADAIRQYFVPQLLVGYFQLKYWASPPLPPPIGDVFDFSRVRVGLH